MKSLIFAGVLLAAADPSQDMLSDAQLLARASAFFGDKTNKGPDGHSFGLHHGTNVLVEVRCSDLCPAYTVRFIHYDAEPGPECDRLGGQVVNVRIPVSIAMTTGRYCIPAILFRNNLYIDHPSG